jgi:hypothetical protein
MPGATANLARWTGSENEKDEGGMEEEDTNTDEERFMDPSE